MLTVVAGILRPALLKLLPTIPVHNTAITGDASAAAAAAAEAVAASDACC